ncbi:hypothetical protein AAULR_25941, partial [Lacticaseibacillus rhamnosus MTCC 5462]
AAITQGVSADEQNRRHYHDQQIHIVVACGSGVATSTLAAQDITAVAKAYGVDYTLTKSSMVQLPTTSKNADI